MNILKKLASVAIMTVFAVAPAFAYGGGGGGGSSVSYNAELTPGFSAISPVKNSTLTSPQTISFEVSANAGADSIIVKVNGEEVEATVTEKADGTFSVSAPMGNVEGTVLISLEASAAVSSNYKRTYIFPVTVGEGNGSSQTSEESSDEGKEFSDIAGDENEAFIKELAQKGVFNGVAGTDKFEPKAVFNRAAAIKTIVKAYGFAYTSEISTNPFGDVESSEWYAPYVAAAKNAGLVKGYGNGSFGPAYNMNIAEGLAVVARASGADVSGYNAGSAWYDNYMAWGVDKGLIDESTSASAPLSRGALARIIASL